jgi:hypothetical protein
MNKVTGGFILIDIWSRGVGSLFFYKNKERCSFIPDSALG